jgi:signal peptidase I
LEVGDAVTLKPLSVAAWGLGLLGFAVAWAVLAPSALLGSTSYLSAYGNSMLPYLQGGDLVVVRPADEYKVGDVVAYHNAILDNQLVLHRVVGFDGTRLVLKGDHNTWLDEYHPTLAEVVGKEWFHVDRLGDVIGRLRAPANGAALFGVAGLFAMGVPTSLSNWILGQRRRLRSNGRKRKGERRPPAPGLLAATGVVLAIAAVGLVASGVLMAYAQRQPATQTHGVEVSYTQVGTYNWTGTAPKGAVYPTGTFATGDPLFLKLAGKMTVRYTYLITAGDAVTASGTSWMTATVQSTQTGWKRSVMLAPESSFTGAKVDLQGTLDVAQLLRMAQAYEHAVGLRADELTVSVVAHVKLTGRIGGVPIQDELAPTLPFDLDSTVLKLDTTAQPDLGAAGQAVAAIPTGLAGGPTTAQARQAAYLTPTLTSAVVKPVQVPSRISGLGLSAGASNAWVAAWWGLMLFGGASLLLLALLAWQVRGRDEAARIESRYGSHLVPVGAIAGLRNNGAIEVTSMASLVRLAERHDRMILHEEKAGEHSYAIHDGELFYFYRTRDRAAASPRPPAGTAAGVG